MEKLKAFSNKFWVVIDKSLASWSIFLMATMAILVMVSVFMRYVLNLTYVWSEELIVYLFISTTYFGSVLCVKEMEHIDIPYFWGLASEPVKRVMEIIVCLVNSVIQISLAYFSFTWIEKTGSSLTSGLYIPFYTVYIMFPICFFLMAIYTFRRIEDKIIPSIKALLKSETAWKVINVLFFGIYLAALYGLVNIYFKLNGIERIEGSLYPVMMKTLFIIFSIMFTLCCIQVLVYAIKRLICTMKTDEFQKLGGEQ